MHQRGGRDIPHCRLTPPACAAWCVALKGAPLATTKPRITVTLDPHAYEVVSRLSKANGESMSAIVTGLVDLAVPSFERVVVMMERAASASEEVKAGMRAALDRADKDVLPHMVAAVGQGDMFLAGLAADFEAAQAAPGPAVPAQAPSERPRRRKVPAEGSTPVPVTRGSGAQRGSPEGGRKAPRKGAAPGLVSVPTSGVPPMKATRKGGARG